MPAKHHVLDIYDVELYRCTKQSQWSKLRRTLDFLDEKPGAAGLAQFSIFEPNDGSRPQPIVVIWIDPVQNPTLLEMIDTAAHEASHAASQILEWIGHELRGTDEPHAYLVGWLTRWILDGILP